MADHSLLANLMEGDCIERMGDLGDASVDAIVTDPPYGLEFMGKGWDGADGFRRSLNAADVGRDDVFGRSSARGPEYRAGQLFQEWVTAWALEALRVLRPGGHLVAFGGTRTYHRLAVGLEDAGFELRDTLAWLYGSGFPKSLDVSKAIDKADGHWRGRAGDVVSENGSMSAPNYERTDKGEPVTAAAAAAGLGTALKPAYEPITLARKSPVGTVAANVMEHGTGALNIDYCRIKFASEGDKAAAAMRASSDQNEGRNAYGRFENGPASIAPYLEKMDGGRWPANVLLDEEAAAMLDEQSGHTISRKGAPERGTARKGMFANSAFNQVGAEYDDFGGASRFFYCAKTDSAERHAGLAVPTLLAPDAPALNDHPTVKPLDLMRWLVRLVTPSGGVVLDPFLGSGTTAIAAALEGYGYIGIEREPEYLRIAQARLAYWTHQIVGAVA